MGVEGLYQQMKTFAKDKNIRVVTPHQVQNPHSVLHRDTVPESDIIIVDYLTMLPRVGEKNAKV